MPSRMRLFNSSPPGPGACGIIVFYGVMNLGSFRPVRADPLHAESILSCGAVFQIDPLLMLFANIVPRNNMRD